MTIGSLIMIVPFFLRGQSLKCKYRSRNHMTQRINEQVGIMAAIEAERHFLKVGR